MKIGFYGAVRGAEYMRPERNSLWFHDSLWPVLDLMRTTNVFIQALSMLQLPS